MASLSRKYLTAGIAKKYTKKQEIEPVEKALVFGTSINLLPMLIATGRGVNNMLVYYSSEGTA